LTGYISLAIAVLLSGGSRLLDALIAPPSSQSPFVSGSTDVYNYTSLAFLSASAELFEVTHRPASLLERPAFFFKRVAPRWLAVLASACGTDPSTLPTTTGFNITIRDARNARLRPSTTGFALVRMRNASPTTDWRSETGVRALQMEMEPEILRLYPRTKRVVWTHAAVRGGAAFGDRPLTLNRPQLDYCSNETARWLFRAEFADRGSADGWHRIEDQSRQRGAPRVALFLSKPIGSPQVRGSASAPSESGEHRLLSGVGTSAGVLSVTLWGVVRCGRSAGCVRCGPCRLLLGGGGCGGKISSGTSPTP